MDSNLLNYNKIIRPIFILGRFCGIFGFQEEIQKNNGNGYLSTILNIIVCKVLCYTMKELKGMTIYIYVY